MIGVWALVGPVLNARCINAAQAAGPQHRASHVSRWAARCEPCEREPPPLPVAAATQLAAGNFVPKPAPTHRIHQCRPVLTTTVPSKGRSRPHSRHGSSNSGHGTTTRQQPAERDHTPTTLADGNASQALHKYILVKSEPQAGRRGHAVCDCESRGERGGARTHARPYKRGQVQLLVSFRNTHRLRNKRGRVVGGGGHRPSGQSAESRGRGLVGVARPPCVWAGPGTLIPPAAPSMKWDAG